jgi:hypothetical protein
MRLLLLAIACGWLLVGTSIAQRGSPDRFVTYLPAADAQSTEGLEYRHDTIKAGRIYVSPDLLSALPFDFLMEETRGAFTHTVPAIRADVSVAGSTYQLNGYYNGSEMSFQSGIQNYKERQAVMKAVENALTSGTEVTITFVDLQSGQAVRLHDGAFVEQ